MARVVLFAVGDTIAAAAPGEETAGVALAGAAVSDPGASWPTAGAAYPPTRSEAAATAANAQPVFERDVRMSLMY
ncbi:hypothetical protein GCM10010253_02970 [Streptomyces badius]|uniref:GDSL family lipase n=1 Tax=Streptomyces badius TaxID=1941 RepID=A0ABQ2SNM5_STRBA|nr:hypothetical protein GCM10010253_02970 [Streptomyces badius]